MDALVEILKVVIAIIGIGLILVLIPVFWMLIFDLARSIDRLMER